MKRRRKQQPTLHDVPFFTQALAHVEAFAQLRASEEAHLGAASLQPCLASHDWATMDAQTL